MRLVAGLMNLQKLELNNFVIEIVKHTFLNIFSGYLFICCNSCSNDLEKIQEIYIQNQASFPIETIIDSEIIYSDSGNVRLILNAKLMNRY